MIATEPATPGDHQGSVPQFPIVLRGYDRHLVDTRLVELLDQLDKQRRRVDEAEQALQRGGRQVPEWFASLGA